jgi:hypothetical protein
MLNTATQRSTVTVDDRRAVFMAVRSRKARDILAMPNEVFIRNMLKDRMGWPRREPAPESVKAVTREMVASFKKAGEAALAGWKAKHPSVGVATKAAEPTTAAVA